MSEQEHTSEPWEAVAGRVYFPDVQGGFDLRGCPAPEATARRIVACVNAMQGAPTDWLEQNVGHLTVVGDPLHTRVEQLVDQRDDLLSKLKALLDLDQRCGWHSAQADAAIALIKSIEGAKQ